MSPGVFNLKIAPANSKSVRHSQGSNGCFARRASRTLPRVTESHFALILLLNTGPAQVIWLVVWSHKLDQMPPLRITSSTVRLICQSVHSYPPCRRTVSFSSQENYFYRTMRACSHCCRHASYKGYVVLPYWITAPEIDQVGDKRENPTRSETEGSSGGPDARRCLQDLPMLPFLLDSASTPLVALNISQTISSE
jgi:hypothetical protein